jgi:hypothetical protein
MADEERREGDAGEGGRAEELGGDTGVKEEGDLTGATSTHSGAGGQMDQTGGTGTAPG